MIRIGILDLQGDVSEQPRNDKKGNKKFENRSKGHKGEKRMKNNIMRRSDNLR